MGTKSISASELDWYLQSVQVQELRALAVDGNATFLDTGSVFMRTNSDG